MRVLALAKEPEGRLPFAHTAPLGWPRGPRSLSAVCDRSTSVRYVTPQKRTLLMACWLFSSVPLPDSCTAAKVIKKLSELALLPFGLLARSVINPGNRR
jgi:hypothetical protein